MRRLICERWVTLTCTLFSKFTKVNFSTLVSGKYIVHVHVSQHIIYSQSFNWHPVLSSYRLECVQKSVTVAQTNFSIVYYVVFCQYLDKYVHVSQGHETVHNSGWVKRWVTLTQFSWLPSRLISANVNAIRLNVMKCGILLQKHTGWGKLRNRSS